MDAEELYKAGLFLLKRDKVKEALSAFKRALNIKGKEPKYMSYTGLCLALVFSMKVFGAAAALTVVAMLFRRRDDRPAVLSGVFLALYLPFTFYAASGMEAVAFTSLVTIVLVAPAWWQPIRSRLAPARTTPLSGDDAGFPTPFVDLRRHRRRH